MTSAASRCTGCTLGSYPGGTRPNSWARYPTSLVGANPPIGRARHGLFYSQPRPGGHNPANLLLSLLQQGRVASPGRVPGAFSF